MRQRLMPAAAMAAAFALLAHAGDVPEIPVGGFEPTYPDFEVEIPGVGEWPVRHVDGVGYCYYDDDDGAPMPFPGSFNFEGADELRPMWEAITLTAMASAKDTSAVYAAAVDYFNKHKDSLKGDPGRDGRDAVACATPGGCGTNFTNLMHKVSELAFDASWTNIEVVTSVSLSSGDHSESDPARTLTLSYAKQRLDGQPAGEPVTMEISACNCQVRDDNGEEVRVVSTCSPECPWMWPWTYWGGEGYDEGSGGGGPEGGDAAASAIAAIRDTANDIQRFWVQNFGGPHAGWPDARRNGE